MGVATNSFRRCCSNEYCLKDFISTQLQGDDEIDGIGNIMISCSQIGHLLKKTKISKDGRSNIVRRGGTTAQTVAGRVWCRPHRHSRIRRRSQSSWVATHLRSASGSALVLYRQSSLAINWTACFNCLIFLVKRYIINKHYKLCKATMFVSSTRLRSPLCWRDSERATALLSVDNMYTNRII